MKTKAFTKALMLIGLFGCASVVHHHDPDFHYECNNYKFRITYKDGLIDTSFVYDRKDSLLEASVWEGTTAEDFVKGFDDPSNSTPECSELRKERQEFLSMVLKQRKKEVEASYSRDLDKNRPGFFGEIWFLLFINPDGKCEKIFVVKNEIFNSPFARDLVTYLAKTNYKADDNCGQQDLLYKMEFIDETVNGGRRIYRNR